MKQFTLIALLSVSFSLTAQKSLTYTEVLNLTKEIKIIDRLYLDISNFEQNELDASTAHQFLRKRYGGNNELPNDTKYYICGKITKHADFDLLFLYAEKNTPEQNKNFDFILLTTRKDGTNISILSGASDLYYTRNNHAQFRKTRSYLYSGFIIKQENEISVMNKKFEAEYRINDYGVFVNYPKWVKG